ncbi:MAG: FAD-binding oxidoreductase [Desulfurococcaceae archaeon]
MKVLIIGAGISGLFIAYELANRGVEDVTIVEASYPGSGATLRNAACFRSSFTSPEHVVLMKESIKRWLELRDELGFELWQKGYLWVARKEETLDTFKKLVDFHHKFGIPTKVLNVEDVKELEPHLNTKIITGAMFDPTAGKMSVLENFTKLYLKVKSMGVKVIPYTKVLELVAGNGEIRAAKSTRGTLEANVFVIAAAECSKEILRTIGVDVPIEPIPRHPIVTEPYVNILKPALIVDWDTPGAPYITQTSHGTFYLARDITDVPGASIYSTRVDIFSKTIKPLRELLPFLEHIYVLRYWMGYYDMTPDHHPIYGPVEPYINLYIAAGFSGHGMMMGPVTGKLIADWILSGKPSIEIANNLTLERFKTGRLVKELAVIG